MKRLADSMGGVYLRYCDDILLITPLEQKDKIAGKIQRRLRNLRLSLNKDKTERCAFTIDQQGVLTSSSPLQYLGFTFDGRRTLIRSAAFARYSQKMKRAVRLAKATMRSNNHRKRRRGAVPRSL